MKIRKSYVYSSSIEDVSLFEVGVSILNKPVKPVYYFYVDGLLIDTGPSLAFRRVLKSIASLPLDQILLTHTHEDHSGNAAVLSKVRNVPVVAHPLAIPMMADGFRLLPYQHVMFGPAGALALQSVGETVQTPKYTFEVIHTPGHAPEHIALYEKSKGWLFSGDLFVAEKIKYFRKGENLKEQIASLKKLVSLDFETLFCGHNPQPTGGKQRMIKKLAYFESLYEKIVHYHSAGYTTKEIMKKVEIKKDRQIDFVTFGDVKPEHIITSVTNFLT